MFLKVELTKCRKGTQKWPGIISELSGIIPELSRRGGAGAAARDHPSTRAGGQDDVSLNKLPQIILAS